jgi:hypothetical protein
MFDGLFKGNSMIDELVNDDYLYHFTSITSFKKIILSNQLLMNKAVKLNDPYEYGEPLTLITSNHELSKTDFEFNFIYQKLLKIEKKKYKVVCFCKDKDGLNIGSNNHEYCKGYGRARMWSQYADNHKGVCLVFSKKDLLCEVKKQISCFEINIDYKNDINDIEDIFNIDLSNKVIKNAKEYFKIFVQPSFYKILSYKYKDYESENEFRIITKDNSKSKVFINYGNSLKYIIFGDKYKDDTTLQKYLNKIECLTIFWNRRGPHISEK